MKNLEKLGYICKVIDGLMITIVKVYDTTGHYLFSANEDDLMLVAEMEGII